MTLKTVSEIAFESFCEVNSLAFERIAEGLEPTPDYLLRVSETTIYVEVKQIDEDSNFFTSLSTRSPGSHIP